MWGGQLSGFIPSIFADSFNRPDSSDLGPAWEEVAGEFDIVDGQLHATADQDAKGAKIFLVLLCVFAVQKSPL